MVLSWSAERDSNPQPCAPKAHVLPIGLSAVIFYRREDFVDRLLLEF